MHLRKIGCMTKDYYKKPRKAWIETGCPLSTRLFSVPISKRIGGLICSERRTPGENVMVPQTQRTIIRRCRPSAIILWIPLEVA